MNARRETRKSCTHGWRALVFSEAARMPLRRARADVRRDAAERGSVQVEPRVPPLHSHRHSSRSLAALTFYARKLRRELQSQFVLSKSSGVGHRLLSYRFRCDLIKIVAGALIDCHFDRAPSAGEKW